MNLLKMPRFFTTLMMTVLMVLTIAPAARAANVSGNTTDWTRNFRRWPWTGGVSYGLSQIDGHEYASLSARKAIDARLPCGTPVFATSSGTVVTATTDSGAGKYVQAKHDEDNDGTYEIVTYEHLESIAVDTTPSAGKPTDLLQGDLVGYSGDTGNTRGCHLHFQRSSTTSFSSSALELAPLNGLEKSALNLTDTYVSANVGIGRHSSGTIRAAIKTRYSASGGYWSAGIPTNISVLWSPCRAERTNGTAWTYSCNPPGFSSGSVQTYGYGVAGDQHAIMWRSNGTAYIIWRGALAAYTEFYSGNNKDYVYTIGYPTVNRSLLGPWWRQLFENGTIWYNPNSCEVDIYRTTPPALLGTYTFCDY